jgi:hypothetical protein
MTQPRIRQLMESRLSTWAAARVPALPVAWEGVPFDPPDTTYLRAFLMPAPTDSLTLRGNHRLYTGIFQVSVVAPVSAGPGAAEGIAEEIAALFPNALRLTIASPAFVLRTISPMSIARGIQTPDRYTVPVFTQYRSDTN